MKISEDFRENIKFMLTITFLSILIFIISLVITNSIISSALLIFFILLEDGRENEINYSRKKGIS